VSAIPRQVSNKKIIRQESIGKNTAILTHEEVADIMTSKGYPMSRSRVAQIELCAIHKLRIALLDIAADEIRGEL